MLEKPEGIPSSSGCYLFRNEQGEVVYVGKALSLTQRLSNYFQKPESLDIKTRTLMREATSVEWIVTPTEVDALILENELIKANQPRYNMRLKDDRSYPYVAIDYRPKYPYAYVTRGPHYKGVRYYGPFTNVGPLRRTIDELLKAYPLRSCSNHKFQHHERLGRPCLLYDVGKCVGPCVGAVDDEKYKEMVASFGQFFDGGVSDLRGRLTLEMTQAAAKRDYEGAAHARDSLTALDRAGNDQRVVLDDESNLDVLSVAVQGSRAAVVLFRVRNGRIIGRKTQLLDLSFEETHAQILETALGSLYDEETEIPGVVILENELAPDALVVEYLEKKRGRRVQLVVPQRGKRKRVLDMAVDDANALLARDSLRRQSDHNTRARALQELGAALGLAEPPFRMECFDMSHLQGTNYVGSMVVFEDGLPKKSDYRHFNVKTILGNDDVGAMHEVVGRRFRHWNAGANSGFRNANLVIIDGGIAQLGAALRAANEAGVEDEVELCALAKREELLYRPQSPDPVILDRGSEALYLVQRIRDEAHRFAISFQRSKRGKSMVASVLDGVSGLGPARQAQLLSEFGSIDDVRRATIDELAQISWLPESVAGRLYDHLHGPKSPTLDRGGE